jgi:alkylation response protein AidB-like acyl-CoA dehydrogenase
VTTTLDELDKRELRSSARGFFERYAPETAVRATMQTPDGVDRELWTQMATQLGFQGLLIPERLGGTELTFSHVQIVMEELGRALACVPFLSTAVLSTTALLAAADERSADLLARIADGSVVAALAFVDRHGRWDPTDDAVRATDDAGTWRLDGTRRYVLDAACADTLLVAASTPDGPSLFVLDDTSVGCTVTPLDTLDMTRRQANLSLANSPATLLGRLGAAGAYLTAAFDAGVAALASEQVGGARRLLEMSVEYAKVREQFGRPIGSFQAIKHKCADMLVEVESATSAAEAAGAAIDEQSTEQSLLASLAKAYCSEAYTHVAAENIQVHGGIGFTWEHPAHLYFRRAKSSEMLFGTPTYHRERMLGELGL